MTTEALILSRIKGAIGFGEVLRKSRREDYEKRFMTLVKQIIKEEEK
ncbi:MAG: hypothetical protein GY750_20880 [Lentisphaerae bacterium]|nr:hypothetical protein [Lentisphaerota bacterium]